MPASTIPRQEERVLEDRPRARLDEAVTPLAPKERWLFRPTAVLKAHTARCSRPRHDLSGCSERGLRARSCSPPEASGETGLSEGRANALSIARVRRPPLLTMNLVTVPSETVTRGRPELTRASPLLVSGFHLASARPSAPGASWRSLARPRGSQPASCGPWRGP